MIPEMVESYAQRRGLNRQDALRTFFQVVLLKHLRHETARLIGGTALVLGYGNPCFSEDIDFTQVRKPQSLRSSLARGVSELEEWMGTKIALTAPRTSGVTWALTARVDQATTVRLHVDSQPYQAISKATLIIEFPGLNPFVVNSVTMQEIMADKLIAVAFRRYLSGRDLFDLWFHWLRHNKTDEWGPLLSLVFQKLVNRGLGKDAWRQRMQDRLLANDLTRAKVEWQRYLPADFARPAVLEEILLRVRGLAGILEP